MAVLFSPWGNQQFSDENGAPATGWKIYTYAAGSSTPLATYTDSGGGVAQTNPILISALGFPVNGQLWLTSGLSYKLVLTDANDVVKKTEDNITGVTGVSSTSQWQASGLTPTYVSAISFTLAGDQTSAFHVGRRLQFTTTAGTVYGSILTSAYGALTTVTMTMDGASVLDSGLSQVNYALLTAVNPSVPATYALLASPVFTGDPTAPQAADGDADLSLANTAYVQSAYAAVRQTVISGPVDTNGLSAFGGATGSGTVTASGTLIVSAANGVFNRRGSITNPSWTGLTTNGTMYLYLDIAQGGACTTGSGTLVPTYRQGGADVVTNNQFTFNIQEMVGKVGNGATAAQTYRVYVGEVTVAGAVVTAITWYQLMGRFVGATTNTVPAAGTMMTSSHNLGVIPKVRRWIIICASASAGYATGEEILGVAMRDTGGSAVAALPSSNRLTMRLQVGSNANAVMILDVSNSTMPIINGSASFSYRFEAERGW